MTYTLTNKRILVTGATDGLGLATAKELMKQGAHVVVHGRTQEKVAQAVSQLKKLGSQKIDALVCDLTKIETIAPVFATIDQLDILINNAGVWLHGDTADASKEKIIELTHVNMLAPLLITKTLLPKLLTGDFAQILNVVSIAGVEIPAGYYHTIYTATKFAMQGFSEGLAKEFYNKNLRVMGYYPGGMETNIFKKAGDSVKQHEPWMFNPQESAEAMVFMLTRNPKVTIKRLDLVNQLEK